MSDSQPTMWGGRFNLPPSESLWNFTVDHVDRRLLDFDVMGSIAHVAMLHAVGLLTDDEHSTIDAGLKKILAEASSGSFPFLDTDEDVHSSVERRLVELVGAVGEKLPTGRSRNDQMALDLRLYLRKAIADRKDDLARFASLLADLAEANAEKVAPTYTHLQQAQTASLGHHFLAYAWMALRDRDRLADLGRRVEVSPLGAGASAGSSLPIDPSLTAKHLGFERVFSNSLDAVGSRDLLSEFAFCVAQAMVHLSRLSEEMVLWATIEFDWVTYSDSFATGSSALPHKKNPDIAELARGKSAGAIGDLTSLLVLQKGLPLSYNSDLQEDKPALFRADNALATTLSALSGMLATAEFHPPAPVSFTATLDLAEALVKRGVPFRQAHMAVGSLVASLMAAGRTLDEVTVSDLTGADSRFEESDLELLDPIASASRRATPGSGSPASVREQVAAIRKLVSGGHSP